MNSDKNKRIAPAVVLAQHGNKSAYRDIYISYYKDIFFICLSMTGDAALSIDLTAEIFIKMFAAVDKLGDHMAFEQWFYSLAINICRAHMKESVDADIIGERIPLLAKNASECAVKRDRAGFEHNIERLIAEMIAKLPNEARVFFFYGCFTALGAEKTALLEKLSKEEAEARLDAVYVLLGKQTEKILEYGIDVSMFINDLSHTLEHLVIKTFVPASVHEKVSKELGVNVDPLYQDSGKSLPYNDGDFNAEDYNNIVKNGGNIREDERSEQTEDTDNHGESEDSEKADGSEKDVKKNFLTKGDLILFLAVALAALIVFSGVKLYKKSKNEQNYPNQISTTESTDVKAASVWNGAAAVSFASGTGKKESPYIIENGAQLAYLSNLLRDGNSYYSSCYYRLDSDIILNDVSYFKDWSVKPPRNAWQPIGYSKSEEDNCCFSGVFDGNDHVISGMYISTEEPYSGLFGIIRNGTVSNLTVRDSYVKGGEFSGGIAGYFSSDTSENSGFSYCSFSGIVSGSNNCGGITGYFRSESGGNIPFINSCCVSGTVSADADCAGGIAGAGEAAEGPVKIIDCFNCASVSVKDGNAGGITGAVRADGENAVIINCYNVGKITGNGNVGGISGSAERTGENGGINISFCNMLSSSADIEAETQRKDDKIVFTDIKKLSSDEMQKKENYEKFNFDEIWGIAASGDYKYPLLRGAELVPFAYSEEDSTS